MNHQTEIKTESSMFGYNVHELKVWKGPFNAIFHGIKNWEYRKNDRNFEQGDILILKEYDEDKEKYLNRIIVARVPYIIIGEAFGIPKEYCVMSLDIIK